MHDTVKGCPSGSLFNNIFFFDHPRSSIALCAHSRIIVNFTQILNSPRGGDTRPAHKQIRRGKRFRIEKDSHAAWNSEDWSGYSIDWTHTLDELKNASSSIATTSTRFERSDNDSGYQNTSTASSKAWSDSHTSTASSNASSSSELCSETGLDNQLEKWCQGKWNSPNEASVEKHVELEIFKGCEHYSRAVDWPLLNDLDQTHKYYKTDARLPFVFRSLRNSI